MNRAGLLQETTAWMDTVDLALCLFIYEVCNDYQDIEIRNLELIVLPHIIPNLIVSRLALRSSHIQLLHVNVHFDTVSYTHLDVYKRRCSPSAKMFLM